MEGESEESGTRGQRLPEGGKGFEGESFGAGMGIDLGGGEGGCGSCGREAGGAQVVGEGLALLGKGLTEEGLETCRIVDAEGGEARGESPADHRGVNLGRRGEGAGRECEELLDGTVELDGDGEQAVVARAGLGSDTVGDFALHHEDGAIERCMILSELEQDGGGDVVRQISDDGEGMAGVLRCGGEVEGEDILVDDGDTAGGEFRAQMRGQVVVELDCEDVRGMGGEEMSDGASAGADFDGGLARAVAESGDDALDGVLVVEEVLAELRLGGHGCFRW
jgi:hypothetical protein